MQSTAMKGAAGRASLAVEQASTLDEAVSEIARILGEHRPIDRVSVRVLLPEGDLLEVAALWSRDRTALTPGMRMTALASSLPEVIKTGAPVVVEDSLKAGFAGTVLATEGISSWVTAPLHDGSHVRGLLSFSSKTSHAFRSSDRAFFGDFVAALETRLCVLLDSPAKTGEVDPLADQP
jgi:GAF domain-containing protein